MRNDKGRGIFDMEGVILTLCLALSCVLIGILVSGALRLHESAEKLRKETEALENLPRTILIKQTAGDLKLSYSVEPQPKVVRRDLERELAVIRAAQECEWILESEGGTAL